MTCRRRSGARCRSPGSRSGRWCWRPRGSSRGRSSRRDSADPRSTALSAGCHRSVLRSTASAGHHRRRPGRRVHRRRPPPRSGEGPDHLPLVEDVDGELLRRLLEPVLDRARRRRHGSPGRARRGAAPSEVASERACTAAAAECCRGCRTRARAWRSRGSCPRPSGRPPAHRAGSATAIPSGRRHRRRGRRRAASRRRAGPGAWDPRAPHARSRSGRVPVTIFVHVLP